MPSTNDVIEADQTKVVAAEDVGGVATEGVRGGCCIDQLLHPREQRCDVLASIESGIGLLEALDLGSGRRLAELSYERAPRCA